jgi:hypothetical protein
MKQIFAKRIAQSKPRGNPDLFMIMDHETLVELFFDTVELRIEDNIIQCNTSTYCISSKSR